ncbi:MAG: hypothetical protein LBR30_05550 [Clostridioides sp.]|nr:hypothetical protein [Clostridioides sp.]
MREMEIDNERTFLIKNAYLNLFDTDNKTNRDIALITTKSLFADKSKRQIIIDENRLRSEYIYFNYYGEKNISVNILNSVMPIILSNKFAEQCQDEVCSMIFKVSRFFGEEKIFDAMMSATILNCFIHDILDKSFDEDIDYIELLENIKKFITGYNLDISRYFDQLQLKKNIIAYQKCRINTIKLIDEYITLAIEMKKEDDILDVEIEDNIEYKSKNTDDKITLNERTELLKINKNEMYQRNICDFILKLNHCDMKFGKIKELNQTSQKMIVEELLATQVSQENKVEQNKTSIKIEQNKTSLKDTKYKADKKNIDFINIKKSILSLLNLKPKRGNIDDFEFIDSMSKYFINLSNFKITSKQIESVSDPRYMIALNIGDMYQDPILNKIKITAKNMVENILYVELTCKSGSYKLKFKRK